MKILYISRDYCPHDHRHLSAIRDGGHEAYFLRLEDAKRGLEGRSLPEGVIQVHWKSGGTDRFHLWTAPSLALDLKKIIIDIRPDLIHAGPIQSAGLVAVLSGFHPLVSMSWGFDMMRDADRNIVSRWVTRNVLQKSDWLFADCRAVLKKAAAYGFELSKSSYFPWGVDLNHFRPEQNTRITNELGWKDSFVLFCNRSWEPQYGVDVVARAFVEAAKKDPKLRLLLLASGSQGEYLKSIFEEGKVLDRVHMPGQISYSDLPHYYHSADLYISASHIDGSSVSLMEALACGLPAVVSNIPGNMEWVTPGEQGWIFNDGNVSELTGIMLNGSKSRVDLAVMSLKARHKAEIQANWQVNQQCMLEGYKKVMAARPTNIGRAGN